MKKVDAFKCEKCKSVYTNQKEAEDCEKSHINIEDIEIISDDFYVRGESLPSVISIRNKITGNIVGYTKQTIFSDSNTKGSKFKRPKDKKNVRNNKTF